MDKKFDVNNIPEEKFKFVSTGENLHDKGIESKPIGYLKDAWIRFKKNKGSVVAASIILILVLFSIVAPMVSQYKIADQDFYYAYCYPKISLSEKTGMDFWDGCVKKTHSANVFAYNYAIGAESGRNVVKGQKYKVEKDNNGKDMYTYRFDSYNKTGIIFKNVTYEEYMDLQKYQDETGILVIYPITDNAKENDKYVYRPQAVQDSNDANYWYKTKTENGKTIPLYTVDEEGVLHFENIYKKFDGRKNEDGSFVNSIPIKTGVDENGESVYIYEYNEDGKIKTETVTTEETVRDENGNIIKERKKVNGKWVWVPKKQVVTKEIKVRKKFYRDCYESKIFYGDETAENRKYDYAVQNQTGFQIRINYYEYYKYYHSHILKDGIKEPVFIFGSTSNGKDIFTCLGGGARLSFLLAIGVSLVNLIVGTIYGAIEGYYGGVADMLMERFSDILSAVPFMIVITLLKMHMDKTPQLLILFIAFFLTGWISAAGRTRMQFYRFKNQEYVMASRTLGASDLRVMFKHIFPNSIGTLITSTVLVIPGMIFSESSLSYLGIINLETGNLTSVGMMLSAADPFLSTYPYMMVFPAVFISLLMLSFNLFGNGLRDAFNPSLRGTED